MCVQKLNMAMCFCHKMLPCVSTNVMHASVDNKKVKFVTKCYGRWRDLLLKIKVDFLNKINLKKIASFKMENWCLHCQQGKLPKYTVLHVCLLYLRECSHASAMITYPCVYEKNNAPMREQKWNVPMRVRKDNAPMREQI